MVNPRYRPTIGNSRKPVGSKAKTIAGGVNVVIKKLKGKE